MFTDQATAAEGWYPEPEPGLRRRPRSRLTNHTSAVWFIALTPLMLLVLSLLLMVGLKVSLGPWVMPAVWIGFYVAALLLARADHAALGRAGHERRAGWAWALLGPPAYLIARSVSLARVGLRGFAPVGVWASFALVRLAVTILLPGLAICALPAVFTAQAEMSIASNASIIGAKISVDCANRLPVVVDQIFTCTAQSTNGQVFDVTVMLQRTNGWITWRVEDWGVYTLTR